MKFCLGSQLQKNEAMEKRLNELKSLILTSVNVNTDHTGPAEVSGGVMPGNHDSSGCLIRPDR